MTADPAYPKPGLPVQLPLGIQFRAAPTLERFLPGPNRQPLATLSAMAENRGESFVHLYGEPGSGKSHLLQGAAALAVEQGLSAAYLPLAELRPHGPAMLDQMEQRQLLLLDELDAIAGLADWEEALFHLFNRLRAGQKRLVTAARQRPNALGLRLPDLESRLGWGLELHLKPLDDPDKEALILAEAERLGMPLDTAAARFLLRQLPRDLPTLIAFLDRLDRASLSAKRRPTIPFIKQLLTAEA